MRYSPGNSIELYTRGARCKSSAAAVFIANLYAPLENSIKMLEKPRDLCGYARTSVRAFFPIRPN